MIICYYLFIQLIEDIEEWQKEHERVFLVDGVTFDQYRRSQWAAIEENEILEKVERNAKRKKQLAVDMVRIKHYLFLKMIT